MRRSVLSPFPAKRSGVRPPFRTKLSRPISKHASRPVALGGLHSGGVAQLRGRVARAGFVARVTADPHGPPMPTDPPALVADRLDARVHLHDFLILFCLLV